ncbi:MAG: exodeoxyribonuclease VII small subunit [Deltaproteobacteria bacterium]|nr:MAG: exodeoxyribonuclease VII small subunit [Deltaproteobacteria bacterium]
MAKKKEEKFEEALKRLEDIVQKLEEGDLPLEDSLRYFEEGVKLSRFLSKKLVEAEKKVEILLKDEKGKLKVEEFEPEGEEEEEEEGGKQESLF